MAVVEPADVDAFLAICEKWEVDATVIGEVTDGDRLQIDWHGERVVDVPPRSVAHDGPTYHRPFARPDSQDELQADAAERLPRPSTGDELRETLLRLVASPNLCDKSWITDQYDRYVQGNTVLAQPSDSGMIRVDTDTNLGVARLHRLQRPVRPPRPVRRCPARARRVLPQRLDGRRHPDGDQRLPELRLAGGPSRDVAVRRGLPRAQGRVCRARHPGHRRQRQPLQPDRRDARSCRLPWSPCSGSSRTSPGARRPASVRPGTACCCSARRARSCPDRCGRTSSTTTSVDSRQGRPRRGARAQRAARRRDRRALLGARRLRRRPGPDAGGVLPAPRRRCPGGPGRGRGRRRLRRAVRESAARVVVSVAPEDEERMFELAAEHGVPITSLGETRGDSLEVDRRRSTYPRGAAHRLDAHPAGSDGLSVPRTGAERCAASTSVPSPACGSSRRSGSWSTTSRGTTRVLLVEHHTEAPLRSSTRSPRPAFVGSTCSSCSPGFVLALNYMDRLGGRLEIRTDLAVPVAPARADLAALHAGHRRRRAVAARPARPLGQRGDQPGDLDQPAAPGADGPAVVPARTRAEQLGGPGLVAVRGMARVPDVSRDRPRRRAFPPAGCEPGRSWCWPA